MSNRRNQLTVAITILMLLLSNIVACSSPPTQPPSSTIPVVPLPSSVTPTTSPAPTLAPIPSPTPTPTQTPTATPTQSAANPEKPVYENQRVSRLATGPNQFVYGEPIGDIANFRLDTDVYFSTAAGDCSYLILFRTQDIDNCYYFEVVWLNNQFAVGKRVKGGWSYLDSGVSPVLKRGELNHIRIICRESVIQVYGNDVKLAEVTDSTYTSGKIYLVARSSGSPRTEIQFQSVSLNSIGK